MSEDSPLSSADEVINPKISSAIIKHIYFNEEQDDDDNENSTAQKIIEHPTPSTIRVDGSDLISRCKDFIPLLSDTNQNLNAKEQVNENLSSEKDDEINFPEILSEKSSKESGEASSTNDDDEKSTEIIKKKRKKKKKKKKKKLKTNDDLNQDVDVNN